MSTTQHPSSPKSRSLQLLATMRDELRERRRVRASYRELERSLASFNSRTEVDDLLATIAHEDGPDAVRVRRILARNLHNQATHRLLAS